MTGMRRYFLVAVFVLASAGHMGPSGAAERIVAIGGDVTEIVYALGHEAKLVAVDSTSLYPAAARALPDVAYMRQLSAEPILAFAPDQIIAIEDAGPDTAVAVLQRAGVRYSAIPDRPGVAGTIAKIRAVGAALNDQAGGDALAQKVEQEIAAVLARLGQPTHRTLFLLSVGQGSLMAGGRGTSADAIIRLAGGDNIVRGFEGYKPLDPEAMNALDPEVVVVTERTLAARGGAATLLAEPQFAGTSAAKAGRLVAMDGTLLLGFGPRLGEAVDTLARALHWEATTR